TLVPRRLRVHLTNPTLAPDCLPPHGRLFSPPRRSNPPASFLPAPPSPSPQASPRPLRAKPPDRAHRLRAAEKRCCLQPSSNQKGPHFGKGCRPFRESRRVGVRSFR